MRFKEHSSEREIKSHEADFPFAGFVQLEEFFMVCVMGAGLDRGGPYSLSFSFPRCMV